MAPLPGRTLLYRSAGPLACGPKESNGVPGVIGPTFSDAGGTFFLLPQKGEARAGGDEQGLGHLCGGALGGERDAPRDAAHPLPLVGRVLERAADDCRRGLLAGKLRDLPEPDHLCSGARERTGGSPRRFLLHPMLEHGSCTGFDTRGEDFPRNVEAEDEGRMTRLACPEAAGRSCQAFARSGQLKRTNDAPAVVRVDGLGRARVALDQQGVRSFGPQAVVELLEARSRAE